MNRGDNNAINLRLLTELSEYMEISTNDK
jgi:hypothetical protein